MTRPGVRVYDRPMQTTHERTALLCEQCSADVLIERHDLVSGDTFVREQRLICSADPEGHPVWQGPNS